jgi:hypothetical protein
MIHLNGCMQNGMMARKEGGQFVRILRASVVLPSMSVKRKVTVPEGCSEYMVERSRHEKNAVLCRNSVTQRLAAHGGSLDCSRAASASAEDLKLSGSGIWTYFLPFLAFFAILFSIKVFSGFFFVVFLAC